MNKLLSDEIVVVTGASGGIGRYVAEEVASQGAVPVLLARRGEKLESLSRYIYETYGIFAPFYVLDVADQENISVVFQQISRDVGDVTVLVNNAGFAVFDLAVDAEMADVNSMFEVNVTGAIACTKEVLPKMKRKRKGHIIFISSLAGKVSTPKASVYSATKHAVLGFANGLRMELADSPLNVSVVNPGPVKTDFFAVADASGEYEKNVEKVMLDPEAVSAKIAGLIHKPKRELNLPAWMGAVSKLYQLFPASVEKLAGGRMNRK